MNIYRQINLKTKRAVLKTKIYLEMVWTFYFMRIKIIETYSLGPFLLNRRDQTRGVEMNKDQKMMIYITRSAFTLLFFISFMSHSASRLFDKIYFFHFRLLYTLHQTNISNENLGQVVEIKSTDITMASYFMRSNFGCKKNVLKTKSIQLRKHSRPSRVGVGDELKSVFFSSPKDTILTSYRQIWTKRRDTSTHVYFG